MEAKTEVNAKKETYKADDALELLDGITKLYAAKGKKVSVLDLKKDKPTEEELKKLMLGPTGNLRAPTLRKGKTLIIGFNEEMYAELIH